MHAAAPLGDDVPAGHGVHAAEPAKLPALHDEQSVAPGFGENSPAPHALQAVAPAASATSPGAHGVQLVAPAAPANVPGSHLSQAIEPAAGAHVPGAHALQAVSDAPVHAAIWCVPAPHTLHARHWPADSQLPLLQLEQCVAPPALHVAQLGSHAAQTVFATVVQAVAT